jgi:HEAT repeat protein
MRPFIVMSTIVVLINLATLQADVPMRVDVGKAIGTLKNSKVAKDRVRAADDIGRTGALRAKDVENAVEPLQDALKNDKDSEVRSAAAKALGNIAPDPEKTVPLLTEALSDKAMSVKFSAITALGQFGPKASSAVTKLRELASEKKDKKLSQAASAAIKQISGKKKKS